MIQFNCIYDKDASKIKRFLKDIDTKEYINYMDIFNKLAKNDMLSAEPSDAVLSAFLFKELQYSLIDRESKSLYYVVSSLDETIINNLRTVISDMTSDEVSVTMYVFQTTTLNCVDNIIVVDEQQYAQSL